MLKEIKSTISRRIGQTEENYRIFENTKLREERDRERIRG